MRYKSLPLAARGSSRPPAPNRAVETKGSRRDWLATLPIVVLVPALVFPIVSTLGAGPSLAVSGQTVAGSSVTLVGAAFTPHDWVQLAWDGSVAGMPQAR